MKIKSHTKFLGLLFFLLLYTQRAEAQQGIGTNAPNEHAVLELASNNKGLLIPRLSLTSSSTFLQGTATASDSSLLVYNTATVTTTGLSGPGFYYWTGGASGHWNRIASGSGLVGTQTNSSQRWDGSAWVEAANFLNSGASTATLATNLTVTGTLAVTGAGARIGGATPQTSAILDLTNTASKVLLLPQTQTASVTTPAAGMLTYDPVTADLHYRDSSQWKRLGYRNVTDEQVFVDTVVPSGFLYVVLLVEGDWKAVKYQKDDPNNETTATSATNGGASRPITLAECQALTYN